MKVTRSSSIRIFISLVAFSLVTVSCSSDATQSTEATSTTQARQTTSIAEEAEEVGITGGPFRVGLVANITTNNWWAAQHTESQAQNQAILAEMKPALFKLTSPGFVFVPDMAATDEPAAAIQNGETWVVDQPIRQDRTWSDGTPVTAHDLVFYFDVVREFALASEHAKSVPPSVLDISASDDYTVRLEFDTPPGLAEWRSGIGLARWVPAHFWKDHVETARAAAEEATAAIRDEDAVQAIVDASLADDRLDNDLTAEDVTADDIRDYIRETGATEGRAALYAVSPVGEPSSGPMIFDSWEPGAFALAVGNVDYFDMGTENTLYEDGSFRIVNADRGEDRVFSGEGTGEIVTSYVEGPYVSEIQWIEHGNREDAYEALAAGDLDYVYDPAGITPGVRSQLAENPDLAFSTNQADGFRYLAFNLRKPPMNDPAFRRATAALIDKEYVADDVLAGAVFPGYTIVHPDLTLWYNPDVNRPGWYDEMPGTHDQRLEGAVQILKDAGYSWDTEPVIRYDATGTLEGIDAGGGLTMPNGEKVPDLEILAPGNEVDPYRAAYASWTETWLSELGVPVTIVPADFTTIIEAVFPPQTPETVQEWDMYVLGWGQISPALPGSSQVAFFHSREDVVFGGGFNTSGFNNPDFDAAADAFESATTVKEAQRWTWEMERILQEELPYVVLFRAAIVEAFYANVQFPSDVIMGGHSASAFAWPGAVRIAE